MTAHLENRTVTGALGRSLPLPFIANPVVRVAARRLVTAVPLLFVVSALSFVLISLTPGDAAREILGTQAPPETYANLRHSLGLDRPLYVQYYAWLKHAVHGDLGRSLLGDESVTRIIDARLPVTFSVICGALLVTVVLGVALGVASAVTGGAVARLIDAIALVGFALPAFWIGAMLIAVFAVQLRWLPATGYVPLTQSAHDWFVSLILPVAALAIHSAAVIAKQTREAMLDALASEYIRMSWASGVSARSIYFRHALKNASMRIVTVIGLQGVALLGGAVLVETVFALPGLGSLAVNASLQHDLPVIQGVVVYFTIIVVAINLAVDLAYTWLNPRVRTA